MNRAVILLSTLILIGASGLLTQARSVDEAAAVKLQTLRVALLGFPSPKANNESRVLESALAEALGRDSRVVLLEQPMIQPALKGIGYSGSINLSKEEARRLAAAIGCDFFIVGKVEALTRSEREKESHEEAFAGIMIVDARTGALARFDFISEKASTTEAAVGALVKASAGRAIDYIDRMIQVRESAQKLPLKDSTSAGPSPDFIEDIPDEGSPRAAGFKPPEFLNRAKPEYTSHAEQADITATVDAWAVFRSNGEVGSIEITRWAGFGLDEASELAIRQLKFKPATRDGKAISVRALIRYNFRRVREPAKLGVRCKAREVGGGI